MKSHSEEKYVPILIPTLNRYNHLKECIESLEHCVGADKTELYISVDYPPSSDYEDGYKKTVEYLKNKDFSMFKNANLFFQNANLGPYENFYFLEDQISEKNMWFISIEDDLVFSENYLVFVNEAIKFFKNDKCFAGVCGYTHLRTNENTQGWYKGYELTYGSALNLSILKFIKEHAKILYDKPVGFHLFLKLVKSFPVEARIYMDFFIFRPELYFDRDGNIAPIDYVIHNVLFFNNLFVVTPTISVVRNMGNDGSGVHSDRDSVLADYEKTKYIDNSLNFVFSERNYTDIKNKDFKHYSELSTKDALVNTIQAMTKYLLIWSIGTERLRKLILWKNKRKKR